ncbi:GNAT family N-acetyltransferase [Dyadobacter fanqingshengii]|uniref:GNAT family N-acetyltransferase n=1 Tax=Dyadobacter fanqingshengii TaxID=2906443 RepID=A0A9X1PEQ2_9BACT|nr:GNAT family N-acetyltransferase [Dyadobacter fanqingshengii]MCF0041892.1 GNAT family N-acetyltransferase [Dyadobacter fanqingshengii]USJ36401.1 GNAT family N-acetyltransferase [Dyadobacter fanqingshengii]
MIQLLRTTSEHPDFSALVKSLDAYLAVTDGDEHAFYNQYNKIDMIKHVVLAYENDIAIGCGAIKAFGDDAMEVKRMFVAEAGRNKGIASTLLKELEHWAAELGFKRCVLETGKRQAEAIALYKKNGYQVTENYGQYIGVANSVCFEKVLA